MPSPPPPPAANAEPSDAICRADVCLPVEGNVLIYHGAHHLSPTYVRTMAGEIGRQIAANTGWW
jgi:hypothetical protein